jgi:histidinol-phosphate aminotransferase
LLQPEINIDRLIPAIHGGIDYAEISEKGFLPDEILDFSNNCNPMGPPPGLKTFIKNVNMEAYPDSGSIELRTVLADKLLIDKDNLIIGSGSTELIRLIAFAYLGRVSNALIFQPSYGEYELACQLAGCTIKKVTLSSADDFKIDIDDTLSQLQQNNFKAIFLCNPDNPTGRYLGGNDVEQIIRANNNCLVILDEAYIAFTDNTWNSIDLVKYDNLVIIRSMTKDFALAGLRIGYAIADKEIISVLNRIKPPWNVSSVAQKAAIYSLDCKKYIDRSWSELQKARRFLIGEIGKMGLETVPSQTNFFLVKVGDALKVRQALLKKGMLVRDCSSFGLPEYIRIAPRKMAQCSKFILALKEVGVA